MVSKLIRRTPTKSIKDHRSSGRRRPRKSPAKKAAATVLASIHKKLVKFFSKLARIGTPKRSAAKGYKILKKSEQETRTICRSLDFVGEEANRRFLLPPPPSAETRTVFLDLDETLVHSKADPPPERYDFVVRPRIDGVVMSFYVLKRPGVDALLEALAAKGYEVVVFTAGLREYASLVIDRLDRKRVVAHRLYREACTEVDGRLVKDLAATGRDLNRCVILDDNPNSYSLQPGNAVPVKPFVDDLADMELGKLSSFFGAFDGLEDAREAVKGYLAPPDVVELGNTTTNDGAYTAVQR